VEVKLGIVPPAEPSWTLHVTPSALPATLAAKVCAPPSGIVTEIGLRLTLPALAPATVKLAMFDVPPPGAGFVTETGYVPAVARSAVVSPIVSCVPLTNVDVRVEPLKLTVEEFKKLLPLMVRACAGEPTVIELGESEVTAGTGLPTVKSTAFEAPPPGEGLVTTTGKLPAVVRSFVVREIVSWLGFTNVGE